MRDIEALRGSSLAAISALEMRGAASLVVVALIIRSATSLGSSTPVCQPGSEAHERVVAVSDVGAADRPNLPFWATDSAWQPKVLPKS